MSPTLQAEAFALLRYDIWRHLDASEFHAAKVYKWSEEDIIMARELIPDLCEMIRNLVPDSIDSPAMETITSMLRDPEYHFAMMVRHYDWK